VHRQPDLFQVAAALCPAGGLAGSLDGGQQEGDQDADDGDDHQQFHQSERVPGATDKTRHGFALRG